MSGEIESGDGECVKAGVLMLWRPTKKAWRKKHVQIFRRSEAGFERLDYKCLKKNDVYKSISLNGLISARLMPDKTYKTVISLTLNDERALMLALKDPKECNPDEELGEWLQLIKDICWPAKSTILTDNISLGSDNIYEQPESVEYEMPPLAPDRLSSSGSNRDVYSSVYDNQEENELYSASSETDRCSGYVFKVTIRETDSAKSCNLSGIYALEVKHDGLTLRNYETRTAIFEWKLEFIRRFGATAKNKVFHFEAGRRCVGYAGSFEFQCEQFQQIPKVIRDCVNKHKMGIIPAGGNSEHSNSVGSSSPSPSGDDNVYSAVDEMKKEHVSTAVIRPNTLSNRNSFEPAPTLPTRTGEEELYQDPNGDNYSECGSTLLTSPDRHGCVTLGSSPISSMLSPATPTSGTSDIYESLQNAVSGRPSAAADSNPVTPVNSGSGSGSSGSGHSPRNTPSSDDDSLYSNIDISRDHDSGTIRSRSMERHTVLGHDFSVAPPDLYSEPTSKSMEHLYDVTPAQEEELAPAPPARRSSYHNNKIVALNVNTSPMGVSGVAPLSAGAGLEFAVPRAPYPCNIPRPPGLLQMLNVPRQQGIKSNLQPRHFADSSSASHDDWAYV